MIEAGVEIDVQRGLTLGLPRRFPAGSRPAPPRPLTTAGGGT